MALKLTGIPNLPNFTSEQISRLPNLRFLELDGGNLAGDFKHLLSKLKWLSWHHCPSDLHANNLCLRNLVVLKLSESDITEDWVGWEACMVKCHFVSYSLVYLTISLVFLQKDCCFTGER